MNKSKTITVDHVRKAVQIIKKGKGQKGIGYDQESWCGTACCVMGHAGLIAGRYRVKDMKNYNVRVSEDAEKTAVDWSFNESGLKLALGILMKSTHSRPWEFTKCFRRFDRKSKRKS